MQVCWPHLKYLQNKVQISVMEDDKTKLFPPQARVYVPRTPQTDSIV